MMFGRLIRMRAHRRDPQATIYVVAAAEVEKAHWYFQDRPGVPSRGICGFRSMKGHGNSFSMTIDALVGARFLPIMGWCRHNDSHFLRALRTKQYPGVGMDRLLRLVMLHRHDDSPSVGKRLAPMAESRLYKIAHWTRARFNRSAVPGCQKAPERSKTL